LTAIAHHRERRAIGKLQDIEVGAEQSGHPLAADEFGS
jgi:hypothetical protein